MIAAKVKPPPTPVDAADFSPEEESVGAESDDSVVDDDDTFWEGDDFDSDTLLSEVSGPAIDTGNVEW